MCCQRAPAAGWVVARRARNFVRTRLVFALLLVQTLLSGSSQPAATGETLTPFEAGQHAGQRVTVCGRVTNTYYSCFVSGKPTFINFGKPYPNHVFSVAIGEEDRAKFDNCPEKLLADKDVCVTGLIEMYDGKPLMIVKDPSQVVWK
jgi:hypothetical protein